MIQALVAVLAVAPVATSFDLVIENARIVDGTGSPWYRADLGVKGERIGAIGKLAGEPAEGRMTSLPAGRFGLHRRGVLRAGAKADLVVFDPERVADRATFDDPHRFSEGFEHVFVAGVPVVENGAPTNARPGRVLRHSGASA